MRQRAGRPRGIPSSGGAGIISGRWRSLTAAWPSFEDGTPASAGTPDDDSWFPNLLPGQIRNQAAGEPVPFLRGEPQHGATRSCLVSRTSTWSAAATSTQSEPPLPLKLDFRQRMSIVLPLLRCLRDNCPRCRRGRASPGQDQKLPWHGAGATGSLRSRPLHRSCSVRRAYRRTTPAGTRRSVLHSPPCWQARSPETCGRSDSAARWVSWSCVIAGVPISRCSTASSSTATHVGAGNGRGCPVFPASL